MFMSRLLWFSCSALLSITYVSADDCGVNEERSECFQAVCRHQECLEKDAPIGCPGLPEGACKKGCMCKSGYLRNQKGVCIPETECPPNPCITADVEDLANCSTAICRTRHECRYEKECAPRWYCITSRGLAVGDLVAFRNSGSLQSGTPGRVTKVYPRENGPPDADVKSQWGVQRYSNDKLSILWSCETEVDGVLTRQC